MPAALQRPGRRADHRLHLANENLTRFTGKFLALGCPRAHRTLVLLPTDARFKVTRATATERNSRPVPSRPSPVPPSPALRSSCGHSRSVRPPPPSRGVATLDIGDIHLDGVSSTRGTPSPPFLPPSFSPFIPDGHFRSRGCVPAPSAGASSPSPLPLRGPSRDTNQQRHSHVIGFYVMLSRPGSC